VAALMVLNSCTEDQLPEENQIGFEEGVLIDKVASEQNSVRVCLDRTVVLENSEGTSGKALLKGKLWENGKILKVKFIGGSDSLKERVMEKARQYEEYANIKFEVVESGDSDLRVAFEQTGASWSYLGTDAKFISDTAATMNFGWFTDNTPDDEISRVTLHEFGHALGAVHEHQSPVSEVQWDEDYVIDYYRDNFGWDEDQVFDNVLFKYDQNLITNSVYDPESIMQYAIDSRFTLDGYSTDWSFYLSDLDKEFIGKTYPFDEEDQVSPKINLALGAETSQVSTDYSGDSDRAVDGNTSGTYRNDSVTHTVNEYRPWWQVRLGGEYEIGDIVIWNRTDNCCVSRLANFDVFIYNDKGERVFKTTILETPKPNVTINAEGVVGSRIRVKLRDDNPLSLAEVQVYNY